MDISKLHYFIILIMLSCGTIVSSCKKIMTEPERTVINLTACVVDRDFVGFQMSGEKGEIGVFVTETGTEKIIEDYANLQYNTVFDTGIMTLTPKASEQIYFSESGSFADIMGYYPYTDGITASNPTYSIDLSDQGALKPENLLFARSVSHNKVMNKVLLSLRPLYSRLNIKIKLSEGLESHTDLPVTLIINKISTNAEFNVMNGKIESYGSIGSLSLTGTKVFLDAHIATVLPQDLDQETVLEIKYPESSNIESHKVNLYDLIERFEMNRQYDVDIIISPKGIQAELVRVSDIYISDWNEDSDIVTDKV